MGTSSARGEVRTREGKRRGKGGEVGGGRVLLIDQSLVVVTVYNGGKQKESVKVTLSQCWGL